MTTFQAFCYAIAIVLLVIASFGVPARVSLALLGAAFALTAFATPTIHAALN